MKILLAGATGFLGGRLAQAFARDGHAVVCAGRRPPPRMPPGGQFLQVDLASVPPESWWLPRLAGVDAVVNAVGILREAGPQTFEALHHLAPVQLFQAAARAQVRLVVQISALGADAQAASAYHLSKRAADDALRALAVPSAIVQPSLVFAADGASARMFMRLAALPVLPLPEGGTMLLQPVHVEDLVEGICRLLAAPPRHSLTVAFVGPRPLSLREYLDCLRRSMGLHGSAPVVSVPAGLAIAAASIAGRWPRSLVDADSVRMLLRGNTADAAAFAGLLGRGPRPAGSFISAQEGRALGTGAIVSAWQPILRWSVALVWIWTGIVSLGLYPAAGSLELLAQFGLRGWPASLALYGAALLDLLLGLLTLALRRKARQWVWPAQLLLIAAYTAAISLRLPSFWLHPFGPISKNLPMMAAIALLWALDRQETD